MSMTGIRPLRKMLDSRKVFFEGATYTGSPLGNMSKDILDISDMSLVTRDLQKINSIIISE